MGIQHVNCVKLFRIIKDVLKPHYISVITVKYHQMAGGIATVILYLLTLTYHPPLDVSSIYWVTALLSVTPIRMLDEGRGSGPCYHLLNTQLSLELCLALGGCPKMARSMSANPGSAMYWLCDLKQMTQPL